MRVLAWLVVLLWGCVANARTYKLEFTDDTGNRVYAIGTATHIGDGVCLTCRHCFVDSLPDDYRIVVDGYSAELLEMSGESDLATLYVESLQDATAYVPAPEDYCLDDGDRVTIVGYANYEGKGWQRCTGEGNIVDSGTFNGPYEDDASVTRITVDSLDGMSGGAALSDDGYLVGIIFGSIDRRCSFVSCASFTRWVYRIPTYHPWRPVLHVWTSNRCPPCHQFWADYTSDAEFRALLDGHFRFPRNRDGTVNQMYYNVDAKPALAQWWGVNSWPCFGVNPASRVYGYAPASEFPNCPPECRDLNAKDYLLWRLGIIAAEPTNPPPQPPLEQQPTPAVITSTSTTACNCSERFQSIEARLDSLAVELRGLAGSQAPAFDDSALRAEIADLRAELDAMRTAELTVNLYQPDGNVQTGTVRIFDPDDSLDLNYFSRVSP